LALNSAAVLWAGNRATTLEEGMHIAIKAIEGGKVQDKLTQLVRTEHQN